MSACPEQGLFHQATAFGLRWRSDAALHLFRANDAAADTQADVCVRAASAPSVRPGGRSVNNGTVFADGVRLHAPGGETFDLWEGTRIDWYRSGTPEGPIPYPVFSTMTALLLAWRGLVPLHASAVAIDGRGLVICGPAGAGKSTLATALVLAGARLVSDDLTVLTVPVPGAPRLLPGRPGIRLHAGIAAMLDIGDEQPLIAGKRIVHPPAIDDSASVAPAAVLLLGTDESPAVRQRTRMMQDQLFRPKWMHSLPKRHWREAVLHQLAHDIRIMTAPPLDTSSAATIARAAERVIEAFRRTDPG